VTIKFLFIFALLISIPKKSSFGAWRVLNVYGEASSERFLSKTLSVRSRGYSLHPFVRAFFFFNVCFGTLLLLHLVWSPRKFRTVSEMEVFLKFVN
jgi:hypothetical protein